MEIPLFSAEDMKTGRGGGKRGTGKRYGKYADAIRPHVAFLKEGIENAPDGHIRVRVSDLAKTIGMTGKHETSIYWGLKYTLFGEGIVVTTGQTKANEPVLVMRARVEGDKLPDSLTKAAEAEKTGVKAGEVEEEAETGSE